MRSTTIWVDNIGSGGIRRNITGESSPVSTLYDCLGMVPSRVSGSLMLEPGAVKVWESPEFIGNGGNFILGFAFGETNGIEYMVFNGRATTSHVAAYLCQDINTDSNAEMFYHNIANDENINELSSPAIIGGSSITPLGDYALPVVTCYSKEHSEIVQRVGRLGYPEISCDDVDSWIFPIFVFDGQNPYTGYNEDISHCIGYGTGNNDDVVDDRLDTEALPVANFLEWTHAYAMTGDANAPNAYGWGPYTGVGAERRGQLVAFAVGYVYVYHDNTMSEMVIFRTPTTGRKHDLEYYFNNIPMPLPPHTGDLACVTAIKCSINLQKEVVDRERTIKGVRVFYNHITRCRATGEDVHIGWTDNASLISNMREVNYSNEDDIAAGMCLLSSALESERFVGGVGVEVYMFKDVYMPYEPAVAGYSQIVAEFSERGVRAPTILRPFYIGERWGSIRGDLADGNAVVVDYSYRSPLNASTPVADVHVIERGSVVKSYTADRSFEDFMLYQYGDGAVTGVRSRDDIYAAHIRGVFSCGGLIWASGVTTNGADSVDDNAMYISHVDPYGTHYPFVFTSLGRIEFTRGQPKCAAYAYGTVIVGTTETIYSVDVSGGVITSFSVTDLNLPGVASVKSMIAIDNTVYIAAKDGHVYSYNPSYGKAVKLTEQLDGGERTASTSIVGWPNTGAVVAHDIIDDILYVTWFAASSARNSIGICLRTGAVFRSNKVMYSAASGAGLSSATTSNSDYRLYYTTGNALYRLERNTTTYPTPISGAPDYSMSGFVTGSGESMSELVVVDKDFDSDAAGWVDGTDDPYSSSMVIMALHVPTESGVASSWSTWWYPCFWSLGFRQVAGYTDNLPSEGYGTIMTSLPLFSAQFAPFKATCSRPPNYYILNDDPATLEYDETNNISWSISKEIALPDQSYEYVVTGVYITISPESTSNAYDSAINVSVSDPTSHYSGSDKTYYKAPSQSRTVPVKAFRRGRIMIPFRSVLRRVMVTVSSSGDNSLDISIRSLGVVVSRFGRGRDA